MSFRSSVFRSQSSRSLGLRNTTWTKDGWVQGMPRETCLPFKIGPAHKKSINRLVFLYVALGLGAPVAQLKYSAYQNEKWRTSQLYFSLRTVSVFIYEIKINLWRTWFIIIIMNCIFPFLCILSIDLFQSLCFNPFISSSFFCNPTRHIWNNIFKCNL